MEVLYNVIFLLVISQNQHTVSWVNTIVQFDHHKSYNEENEMKQFDFILNSASTVMEEQFYS